MRSAEHRRRVQKCAGVSELGAHIGAPAGSIMKVVVVVQARTSSTRLPGKVLLPVAEKPLLWRMLERVAAAATPFELVVATTTCAADDGIRELCRRIGVRCVSGHPTDLLDRHLVAARAAQADLVAKIPSDCPLIDPAVIDRVLGHAMDRAAHYDFVSNLHPPSYPDGNDVEVVPFSVLEQAHQEARRPYEREHTTPFIWDQPERFRLANVLWETGRNLSMTHRFTIDYREDYEFIRAVFAELWTPARPIFKLAEILALLEARPDIFALNTSRAGINWYRHHLGELRTIGADETRSEESA